jgi:hypothetical protein
MGTLKVFAELAKQWRWGHPAGRLPSFCGGTQDCRQGQRQRDRASAKETLSNRTSESEGYPTQGEQRIRSGEMEDVLKVYHRRHDRNCPLVCVDESSKQLIKETRTPLR